MYIWGYKSLNLILRNSPMGDACTLPKFLKSWKNQVMPPRVREESFLSPPTNPQKKKKGPNQDKTDTSKLAFYPKPISRLGRKWNCQSHSRWKAAGRWRRQPHGRVGLLYLRNSPFKADSQQGLPPPELHSAQNGHDSPEEHLFKVWAPWWAPETAQKKLIWNILLLAFIHCSKKCLSKVHENKLLQGRLQFKLLCSNAVTLGVPYVSP